MYGAGDPADPWLLTRSDPACLCAMDPAHPGCAQPRRALVHAAGRRRRLGLLLLRARAQLLPLGLRPVHAERPPRLAKYHLVVWPMALMFSWWYLPPSPPPAFDGSAMVGYGYRPQFMMCWAPDRRGPRFQLNNAQALVTATVPIFVLWLTAPVLYLYARRLLRMGGSPTEAMLEPRRRQLQQTETLLRVFSIYWFLTGLAYLVGYAFEVYEGEGACDPYQPDGKVAYDSCACAARRGGRSPPSRVSSRSEGRSTRSPASGRTASCCSSCGGRRGGGGARAGGGRHKTGGRRRGWSPSSSSSSKTLRSSPTTWQRRSATTSSRTRCSAYGRPPSSTRRRASAGRSPPPRRARRAPALAEPGGRERRRAGDAARRRRRVNVRRADAARRRRVPAARSGRGTSYDDRDLLLAGAAAARRLGARDALGRLAATAGGRRGGGAAGELRRRRDVDVGEARRRDRGRDAAAAAAVEAFADVKTVELHSGDGRHRLQRVTFTEYAPRVWQWLRREVFGVSHQAYLLSMGREGATTAEVLGGEGRRLLLLQRRHAVHDQDDVLPRPPDAAVDPAALLRPSETRRALDDLEDLRLLLDYDVWPDAALLRDGLPLRAAHLPRDPREVRPQGLVGRPPHEAERGEPKGLRLAGGAPPAAAARRREGVAPPSAARRPLHGVVPHHGLFLALGHPQRRRAPRLRAAHAHLARRPPAVARRRRLRPKRVRAAVDDPRGGGRAPDAGVAQLDAAATAVRPRRAVGVVARRAAAQLWRLRPLAVVVGGGGARRPPSSNRSRTSTAGRARSRRTRSRARAGIRWGSSTLCNDGRCGSDWSAR